jgi:LemA protein
VTVVLIAAAVVLLIVIIIGASYNRFVRQRNLIDNSWSNIDTELKRRYDLIPNLVETVEGYASHEASVFQAVTEARTQAMAESGSPEQQARRENNLVGNLKSLLAVSEAYPDLKASKSFLELQQQLVDTEDRIQGARRFYNNNVRDYNERVQSLPTNFLAGIAGFHTREYFEVDEAVVSAAPQVDLAPPADATDAAGGSAVGPTEPNGPGPT